MPFRPWIRWKSERTQPSTFAEDLVRLAADPRVHRLFEWFSRHERDIADFQLAITAIPAPPFAEQTRAFWLSERLQPFGLTATIDAVGNLLAARPGGGQHPPAVGECGGETKAPAVVAVSAHLDTVFPASTLLSAAVVQREQNRLIGPGISDNGCGLAALWALAAALHEVAIVTSAPLLFVANVGEEGEGNLRGIRHLYRACLASHSTAADDLAPRLACLIALDGAGNGNIISQALGSRRFEIDITGPGGHSWSDHGAPNPIVAAALAVEALFRIPLPSNPRTTLNVGTIEGGTSVNTIPERATLKVDLRSADPRRLDDLEQQLRRVVADACAEAESRAPQPHARLSHSITKIGERPAGELPASSPLLAAIRAVDAQLGIQSQLLRASTDANVPLSLGLEAISLGGGGTGGGAHTLHEWYEPAGREQALKRLTLLILLLAGLPPAVRPRDAEPNPREPR
jgi:acetylornithine deacetylase/succinyl-diaminopimelate desuccinylase-like protein